MIVSYVNDCFVKVNKSNFNGIILKKVKKECIRWKFWGLILVKDFEKNHCFTVLYF